MPDRIDVRQKGVLLKDGLFDGLFGLAFVGYGVALIVANQAVAFFEFGQPALLYIVPLVLIPITWRTKHEGTFDLLWEKISWPRSEEHRRLLKGSVNNNAKHSPSSSSSISGLPKELSIRANSEAVVERRNRTGTTEHPNNPSSPKRVTKAGAGEDGAS